MFDNKMQHITKLSFHFFQESYLYQYKIYGTLKNVSPEICAQVYMDLEYRKKWDTYVVGMFLFLKIQLCFN